MASFPSQRFLEGVLARATIRFGFHPALMEEIPDQKKSPGWKPKDEETFHSGGGNDHQIVFVVALNIQEAFLNTAVNREISPTNKLRDTQKGNKGNGEEDHKTGVLFWM